MKVAITIPCHGDTKAHFTMALVDMVTWSVNQGGFDLVTVMCHGSSRIDYAREMAADLAMAKGPDRLLWLDVDHIFEHDTLARLAAHDLPIVGCNYPKKNAPTPTSSAFNVVAGRQVQIEPKREGLEQVDVIGFGVCLIKAELFAALPRPWFQMGPFGEDGYFFDQARQAGFAAHVDHSIKVGHVAETVLAFP